MIIVADSGSTKTDWRVISPNGAIDQVVTEGINPFHQRAEDISSIIEKSDLPRIGRRALEIYFYGAGCNYPDKIALVKDSIKKFFPQSDIYVSHDLIAAARALCGNNEGIACILGTGSNSCYYDGEQIHQAHPSLGYILGDEGSGAYMGKKFMRDYFYDKVPTIIMKKFEDTYQLNTDQILDSIYSKALANRFLASFSTFFKENSQHPYIHGLVYECFYDFIDTHVIPYQNHEDVPTNFVGSIAFHFQDILEKVVIDAGLQFGKVIKSPIVGLATYHQNNSETLNEK